VNLSLYGLAAENMYFAMLLRRRESAAETFESRCAEIAALLARVDLSEKSQTLAAVLSGGERKRLSVAQALTNPVQALFLDEPTSGLDDTGAYQLFEFLRSLAVGTTDYPGMTVVVTIHQPRMEIYARFDRIVAMKEGRCVLQGGPAEVGEAAMTIFSEQVKRDSGLFYGTRSPKTPKCTTLEGKDFDLTSSTPSMMMDAITSTRSESFSASQHQRVDTDVSDGSTTTHNDDGNVGQAPRWLQTGKRQLAPFRERLQAVGFMRVVSTILRSKASTVGTFTVIPFTMFLFGFVPLGSVGGEPEPYELLSCIALLVAGSYSFVFSFFRWTGALPLAIHRAGQQSELIIGHACWADLVLNVALASVLWSPYLAAGIHYSFQFADYRVIATINVLIGLVGMLCALAVELVLLRLTEYGNVDKVRYARLAFDVVHYGAVYVLMGYTFNGIV
jgi:ABC-type multidrug transport system ATPase subunit